MTGNYQPIENYGIIGNMHTAALVGMDGSIDWLCLPHFDSPSVFAAILDDRKGGRFRIAPARDDLRRKQYYWPGTNVLITRFLHSDGVGEIEDYMPVGEGAPSATVRRVRTVRGALTFRLECRPAFDYARTSHETHMTDHGIRFDGPGISLALCSSIPLKLDGTGVTAEFTLKEGEHATFMLSLVGPSDDHRPAPGFAEAEELFRNTVGYWRRWLSRCTYTGRWREMVERSALALKLLAFEPTGAIVAAPTCSLPELIGGPRNWDYRFTWIRDAAFTLYAFERIGFTEEAVCFKDWIKDRWQQADGRGTGPLQPLYGIDGRADLTEQTLDHLEGYRGSQPVRIGNGAHQQLQLDIYGELMDAAYLTNKYVEPIAYDGWMRLRQLLNWLCDNWRRDDESVWEVRGGPRSFVYSKFMSWVALDRGLRLADKRSFPADRARWLAERDEIYETIMQKGWNSSLPVVHAVVWFNRPRRVLPADAACLFHGPERSAHARHGRRDSPAAGPRRAGGQWPGLPLRSGRRPRRPARLRRDVQHVLILARRGPHPRRPHRPRPTGRRPASLRANARLFQSPRPLCRTDGFQRRSTRKLSAGLHPPGLDQRGVQPRQGPGRILELSCWTPRGNKFSRSIQWVGVDNGGHVNQDVASASWHIEPIGPYCGSIFRRDRVR